MLQRQVRIVGYTHGEEYEKLVAPCLDTQAFYAGRHDYVVYDYGEILKPGFKNPQWMKLVALKENLSLGGTGWVAWFDSDISIMSQTQTLEGLLERYSDTTQVVLNIDPRGSLNTGCMFFRCGPFSRDFIDSVLSHEARFCRTRWADQAAVMYDLWCDPQDSTSRTAKMKHIHVEMDSRRFNAYHPRCNELEMHVPERAGLYQPGDFLIHYLGRSKKFIGEPV